MSTYKYSYNPRNLQQNNQASTRITPLSTSQQQNQLIQSLRQQLKQKQSLLAELSKRLQDQEKLLEQKEFIIKEKQLELEYIHKENQELHQKIYQLNQKLNHERAEIKDTIKEEVGLLKEQFNFMLKENQIKSQIIIEQKEKQFKRIESELKSVIRQLSEKASSNNGSFYYEQSHSNIIKSKKMPNTSYVYRRNDEFFENDEQKSSTANSNLKNSRQSYRSTHLQNKFGSLRGSKATESNDKGLDKGVSSVSNLISLKDGNSLQVSSQAATGRFGSNKPTTLTKLPIRRIGQGRQQLARTSSKPNIEQIISRSKKQFDQRNKKTLPTQTVKPYGSIANNTINGFKPIYRKTQTNDTSKLSGRHGNEEINEKRKMQKLKQISSLKMKVNMLKTQLQQEITFCQITQ